MCSAHRGDGTGVGGCCVACGSAYLQRLKRIQLRAPCAETPARKPWQQPSAHMWMSGATLSHEKGGHTCRVSAVVVVAAVLWGSYPRPTTGAPVAPTCSRQNTAQPVEDSPARAFPKRRLGGGRKNQLLRRILKFSPLLQLQESYSQAAGSCSHHTRQMTCHHAHKKLHQSACHGM